MLAAPLPSRGDLEEGRPGLDESTVSPADRAGQAAVRTDLMVSMCEEDKAKDVQRQPLPTALLGWGQAGPCGGWITSWAPGFQSCC